MKTKDLPLSENVEDRREGGPPLGKPQRTLNEQLDLALYFKSEPESKLAKEAGVDDVESKDGPTRQES